MDLTKIKIDSIEMFKGRASINVGKKSLADVWGGHISGIDDHQGVARRLCAAWNACEGIPTGDLEAGAKKDHSYWRMQSVRNAIDRNIAIEERDALREQNARYLAAVQEMEKMLPVLEYLSQGIAWKHAIEGEDVDLNAYRLTLETALAKRSKH